MINEVVLISYSDEVKIIITDNLLTIRRTSDFLFDEMIKRGLTILLIAG